VNTDAVDWLMVIAARRGSPASGPPLEWIPIDVLAGGPSVLDYQTWAIARCLEAGWRPNVDGPFGTLDWPDHVRGWLANTLRFGPCSCTSYRASPFEVVAAFDTPRARVYFKGLAGARISEPIINQCLAAAAPDSFARTLALERREDGTLWWVTAECPGRPASDPDVVAAALARLQCQLREGALDAPELPRVDLPAAAFAHLPESWMPMDLDPSNVLVDGGQVRFIDLDDSFIGPAPLAMAGFARRCGAAVTAYRAYERAWTPPLGALDWRHLENEAIAFQTSLGWKRVLVHIDRGEVHADLDLLRNRIHARLARAIQRG